MKFFLSTVFIAASLFCVPSAPAQLKPTSNAAKSVIDFYFNGQGRGVVLADIQVCTDVIDNQCVEPIDPLTLQTGMEYKIWLMFIVPQGESIETLSIQFFREGNMAYSRNLAVRGALRYRTWRAFKPDGPGRWEIRIFDNREVEIETVGLLEVFVQGNS